MKRVAITYFLAVFLLLACGVGNKNDGSSSVWEMKPAGGACDTIAIDTMNIGNPFVMYDNVTDMYCMTGDGGHLWTSRDLRLWTGPYDILRYDTASWVGASPAITSPEIHKFGNKYYFMATFEPGTGAAPRRSCTTLVADSIVGPYVTIDSRSVLLDASEVAAYPTFCSDEFGAGYMIYNHEGAHSGDGTVQIVRYTDDLGRRMGEAYVMFTASQVPWARNAAGGFSPLMESPDLFYTGEEGLGMLFTACAGDGKAVGVAYSATGTLNGPWVVEDEPLLKGVSCASMFNDYDGTLVMVVAKDTVVGGKRISVPVLLKADSQFEKLQIKGHYKF